MDKRMYKKNAIEYLIDCEEKNISCLVSNLINDSEDFNRNVYIEQLELVSKIKNVLETKDDLVNWDEFNNELDLNSYEQMLYDNYLKLDEKIQKQDEVSKLANIDYYDNELFTSILKLAYETIENDYNLHAGDEHVKLVKFFESAYQVIESYGYSKIDSFRNLINLFKTKTDKSPKEDKYDVVVLVYEKKYYGMDLIEEVLKYYRKQLELKTKGKDNNLTSSKRFTR